MAVEMSKSSHEHGDGSRLACDSSSESDGSPRDAYTVATDSSVPSSPTSANSIDPIGEPESVEASRAACRPPQAGPAKCTYTGMYAVATYAMHERRTVRLERVTAPKVAAIIEQRSILQIHEQSMPVTGGFAFPLRVIGAVQDHDCAGRREGDKEQPYPYTGRRHCA